MDQQSFKVNFALVGGIDSARTAHVFKGGQTKNNWWLPRNEETRLKHNISAEAVALKRIISGEILALPRNQFFDSPPWFNLAGPLLETVEPAFSLCLFGNSDLSSLAYVKEVADCFADPDFFLSAWPGLELEQRRTIATNMLRGQNFRTMFEGVTLDSSTTAIFEYQGEILQKVLETIERCKKEKRVNYLVTQAKGDPTHSGKQIYKDIDNPAFEEFLSNAPDLGESFAKEYIGTLNEIRKKAFRDIGNDEGKVFSWLSKRTNLFAEIWNQPPRIREMLRQHIDLRYVEALAISCTGRGVYASLDRVDTGLDHNIRDIFMDQLDRVNNPLGLIEDTDLFFVKDNETGNTLSEIAETLCDSEVATRISNLRRIRQEYDTFSHTRKEQESIHMEFMENRIPELAIENFKNGEVVKLAYSAAKTTVVAIGSSLVPDIAIPGGILYELLKEHIKNGGNVIDLSALKKKGGILMDKLLVNKKEALTGKVRQILS